MSLSGVHTSAKVKQSPLMQSNPIQNQTHSHRILATPNRNSNPNVTLSRPDYHQNLTVSIEFCENLLNSFCVILLINKQITANENIISLGEVKLHQKRFKQLTVLTVI